MKFMVQYPLETDDRGEPWAKPESMIAFAQALEANGIDAVSLTDHPAPSKKWMDGGGHATLDPFVGLSFFAAATERLHVKTGLAVLPYRNPLMTAKSMTSVDVVSGGRGIFVLGAGYLRSEFAALGVDFSERNFLFDEAIEAMLGFWGTDDFHFEGRHFTALGVTLDPGPVTKPHPPIWLGGNARIVRDRVARWGFGWSPMQGGELLARTARTVAIETD